LLAQLFIYLSIYLLIHSFIHWPLNGTSTIQILQRHIAREKLAIFQSNRLFLSSEIKGIPTV